MTDERLRELERRWRESGTVEDEAAYLRERVRVGDLDQERLELAANLGQPAALKVVPVADQDWLEAISSADQFAMVRAGLALDRHIQPADDWIQVAENWCLDPSAKNEEEATEALGDGVSLIAVAVIHSLAWAPGQATSYLAEGAGKLTEEDAPRVFEELTTWLLGYGDPVRDRVEARAADSD